MFLYIIHPQDSDMLIKIGISAKPLERIAQLQTGHPRKLRFSRVFHCQSELQARTIESSLHQELATKHANGGSEWVCGDKYRRVVRSFKRHDRSKFTDEMPMLWNVLRYAKSGTHKQIVEYLESFP